MRENYTKIQNSVPENPTINILADLLSGKSGELSSISQYFFQEIMTSDMDLKSLLKEIREDEQMHAKLLAEAIVEFGGIPILCNHYNKFFTTEYIDYSVSERDFLLADIKGEEMAIKNYQSAIDEIDNESLKQLLGEIRDDEKDHLKKLKEQLERF